MTSKYTNKNGVKLLAAVLVFAMAFAGAAVFFSEESAAEAVDVGSLKDLTDSLTSGKTDVKLTEDIAVTSTLKVTGDVTIDLNGHTITGNDVRVFLVSGKLNLTGEGKVTSVGDTITSDDSVIRVGTSTGTETTPEIIVGKDVTIDAPVCYGITIFGKESKMIATINGAVVSKATAAISGNGTSGLGETEITINETAVVKSTASSEDGDAAGIYHPQKGTLTINGGYVGGTGSGIGIKSGVLNMISGTIKATGADSTPAEGYSNGINASGAAIQIESNPDYQGKTEGIEILISGGTIESVNGVAFYEYLDSDADGSYLDTITITGGTIKSVKEGANYLFSEEFMTKLSEEKATFTITGGSFSKPISDMDATISVGSGCTLEADVTLSARDNKLEIASGGTYVGVITYDRSSADVRLTAGIKGLTLTAGSIIIEGEIATVGNTITVTGGIAKLVADIPEGTNVVINAVATLQVDDDVQNAGNIVNNGTITVAADASLASTGTIRNAGSIGGDGKVVNDGNIITEDSGTISADLEGNTTSSEIKSGTLTLNNYNGKAPINGSFTEVVLIGDNVITLEGTAASYALYSTQSFTIKSVDGIGSLTIIVDTGVNNFTAIKSDGDIKINGVPVDIIITGDAKDAVGISAKNFEIYSSELNIVVCENDYTGAVGIKTSGDTTGVDIKSSDVTITAGSIGIDSAKDVNIAASDVAIDASEAGIEAIDITITNASIVDLTVYGLAETIDGAFGVIAGSVTTQTDSVLITDGMKITDIGSKNNATVISNDDIVILNGADYTNAGSFTNNATIGVYGTLTLSAGEFVNNGVLNTYTLFPGDVSSGVDITVDENTGSKLGKIKITECVPLADGTFAIEATITLNSIVAVDKFYGTLVYNGTTLSIDAQSSGAILSVYYDDKEETHKAFVTGTVTLENATETTTVDSDYEANVSVVTNLFSTESTGAMAVSGGKLSNDGSMILNGTTTISGGEVVNAGDITLNNGITMTSGKLSGDAIAIAESGIDISLKGTVDMEFTYSGEYTTGTPVTKVQFDDAISVVGDVTDVGFATVANGIISITKLDATGKASVVTVESGDATFTGSVEKNVLLKVLSGASLKIETSAKATAGVIAIQDGAEILMKISGDKDTFKYGVLDYTISFANDGYTYYGSLQYALANAAEGATLNLNGAAQIDTDTVVKKGITLVFGEGSELTVSGDLEKKTTLSMGEGASFVLAKNAKVVIDFGKAIVSGTVVYDGNAIVLDKVEFTTANAQIGAVPATKTAASEISISGTAVAGNVIVSTGTASGALAIKDVEVNGTVKTVAGMTISEGAVSKIVVIDEEHTTITVDGTMNVTSDMTVNGKITGDGAIVLNDGVSITFKEKAVADVLVGNGTDGFVFQNADGKAYDKTTGAYDGANSKTFEVSAIAKNGNTAAYVALSGDILNGTVTTQGNTAFGNGTKIFTLGIDTVVVVPVDSTLTIIKNGADTAAERSKVDGLLKVAGTLNMKVTGVASTANYGTLSYEITFEKDGYTVYTGVANGIANAEAGDVINIDKPYSVSGKLTIPAGVSVVVGKDVQITVPNDTKIIIGSSDDTLGATGSIVGKVVLEGTAYVLAYNTAGVDLSSAEIVYNGKAAADIEFNVLNNLYATAYIGATTVGTLYDAVKPVVDGYRFAQWTNIDGNAFSSTNVAIATEDFYAKMAPSQVQVTFTYVDGIIYYVDGKQQNIVGAPVYVDYNAIITAGKLAGYEGTPLVNGETYVTVKESMTIVGSFSVSPVTPVYNVYFVNGTEVAVQNVKAGELAVEPAAPVKDGFKFLGWYNGGVAYDFTAPVNDNIVLVAVFEAEQPAVEPCTGFEIYAKSVDGKIQFRIIGDDGYIADGVLTVTMSYTYYDDFVGDYMTKTINLNPVTYVSEEKTDVTIEVAIPEDQAYFSASAVFVSGSLEDKTGTIFI